jgi:hypothetical protein
MGPWRFPVLTFAMVGLRLLFANHALIWGVTSLSRRSVPTRCGHSDIYESNSSLVGLFPAGVKLP